MFKNRTVWVLGICLITNIGLAGTRWDQASKLQYYDSGHYSTEVKTVLKNAQNYLLARISQNAAEQNPKKLAIVLDIDETVLTNMAHMREIAFQHSREKFDKNIEKANIPALPPAIELYKTAKQHGVAIFFVTGRPEKLRKITLKNLQSAGFKYFNALYLKPNSYHEKSIVPFKSNMRRHIAHLGYNIVENIGDQYSDIKGGFAEKSFKLPNPYYTVP